MTEDASITSVTPYVQIAAFCQTAIQEANGILSIIRITDRYQIVGQTKEVQSTTVNLTLVVILKSGNMQGSATMTIRPITPSGTQLPQVNIPVLFEGLERGVGIITQMGINVTEIGLYWFDVIIDDIKLTRIPLRILYVQGQQIGFSPPPAT